MRREGDLSQNVSGHGCEEKLGGNVQSLIFGAVTDEPTSGGFRV